MHQILPWFITYLPSEGPGRIQVRQDVRDKRDEEEHTRTINDVLVDLLRLSDGKTGGPDPIRVVQIGGLCFVGHKLFSTLG